MHLESQPLHSWNICFPHSTQQADEQDKNFRDTLISLTHPNRSIPTIFGEVAATSVSAQNHVLRVKIKDFIFMNFADFFLLSA